MSIHFQDGGFIILGIGTGDGEDFTTLVTLGGEIVIGMVTCTGDGIDLGDGIDGIMASIVHPFTETDLLTEHLIGITEVLTDTIEGLEHLEEIIAIVDLEFQEVLILQEEDIIHVLLVLDEVLLTEIIQEEPIVIHVAIHEVLEPIEMEVTNLLAHLSEVLEQEVIQDILQEDTNLQKVPEAIKVMGITREEVIHLVDLDQTIEAIRLADLDQTTEAIPLVDDLPLITILDHQIDLLEAILVDVVPLVGVTLQDQEDLVALEVEDKKAQ